MAERELGPAPLPGVGPSTEEIASVIHPLAGAEKRALSIVLSVVLITLGVLALYWKTTLSMVAIWERSETFAHGFAVIPIFCYLVWRKRDGLAAFESRPCWGAVLGLAVMGVVWLVGELVNAAIVSQFVIVAMVPFAVWTVLGTRIAAALVIPFALLFFAVPFGEILVPTLMDWTAQFTVTALRASGVPVYQEGNYFIIPSGAWSVVEACSGLRYLIASLMVGCLYAYLSYRSPLRRIAFIAASIVIPVIANWLRAYMIVMLGHLSNNRIAVGVDHLIYGWIFFGLVMIFMFWVGSRWREDEPTDPDDPMPHEAIAGKGHGLAASRGPRLAAAGAAFVVIAIWQPLLASFDTTKYAETVRLATVAGRDGWVATADDMSAWKPDLSGSRDELKQTFAKDGQRVGLDIAFYRGQTSDAKAITSTNQLVRTTNPLWRRIGSGTASVDLDGWASRVNTAVIQRSDERLAVWQWYWVDGHVTSSESEAKLRQAISILRGRGDSVAWVVIYVPGGIGDAQARARLQEFVGAMSAPIGEMLRKAAST